MLMTKRSLYCGSPLSRNIMYVFIQCWCRNGPFISFFGTTVPKHKNILYSLLMSKRFFYFGSALSRNVMYVCIQYWCKNGPYISGLSGMFQAFHHRAQKGEIRQRKHTSQEWKLKEYIFQTFSAGFGKGENCVIRARNERQRGNARKDHTKMLSAGLERRAKKHVR